LSSLLLSSLLLSSLLLSSLLLASIDAASHSRRWDPAGSHHSIGTRKMGVPSSISPWRSWT